jgi:hypothetical protein
VHDGGRRTDGTRQRADEKQGECVSVGEEEIARHRHHHQIRTGEGNESEREDIPESYQNQKKRGGHFIKRMSSNVWGYRYVVVCQWTCYYPCPGSHYDCTRSPLHEQGQSASSEKMMKTQRQTRTQTWTREQAREKSHYHAMWSGKDSEVPDRMAAVGVRNASDPVAERAVEESSAEERSAAVAVAHGHGRVRLRAHEYYSRVYSYAVIQVRAAGGFEGAGDRGGEAQGTTTREFAGVTRIQMRRRVQRAMVVIVVMTTTTTVMCVETEVFHCSCCCSGQESGGRRQSGGGEVSLSDIGSGRRREAKRHLILGPVDARAERDD